MKKLNLLFVFVCCCFLSHSSFGQFNPIAGNGNIEVGFQFIAGTNEYADNLNCVCYADASYSITLHNSSLNDTVLLIYGNYSQIDTVVNILGSSEFYAGIEWSKSFMLNVSSDDYYGMGYNFGFPVNKIIAQNDTLDLGQFSMGASPTVSHNCTFDQVDGNLFIDNNISCTNDAGDDGIWAQVSYTSNYTNGTVPNQIYTNYSGYFINDRFKSDGFINATFTVPSIYNFAFNIPACSQIMYNITSLPATGIDFARECASGIDVMASINIGVWPGIRVATPFNLSPNVANFGCQTADGLLELVLDPNVTYDAINSYNPADSISGNSLFWHYSNLTNVGTNNTGYWNSL